MNYFPLWLRAGLNCTLSLLLEAQKHSLKAEKQGCYYYHIKRCPLFKYTIFLFFFTRTSTSCFSQRWMAIDKHFNRAALEFFVACQLYFVNNNFSPRLLRSMSPSMLSQHPSLLHATLPDSQVLFPGTATNNYKPCPSTTTSTTLTLFYLDNSPLQQCHSISL